MRVFLTGGTGLIGRRLVAFLLARGDAAVVLTRRAPRQPLPAGAEVLVGDPAVAGDWLTTLLGCEGVVHLAGAPILGRRWGRRYKQELRDSRVGPTRLIAGALAQSPRRPDGTPRVWVSGSAVGYYGFADDSAELDEEAPAGHDELARLCVDWEGATRPAADAGVRVALARTGVVLDPDGGALPKMARPYRLFAGGPLGSGRQWVSWIHRDDEVGLLAFALDSAAASGPFNLTAPEPVTNWGLGATLGKVLRRPHWLPAPAWAIRVALGEAAELVVKGQRVLPRRAAEWGYRFRHPEIEAALRDLLGRPAAAV